MGDRRVGAQRFQLVIDVMAVQLNAVRRHMRERDLADLTDNEALILVLVERISQLIVAQDVGSGSTKARYRAVRPRVPRKSRN